MLHEWFSSPFVGRRALRRDEKRVHVTVDGKPPTLRVAPPSPAPSDRATLVDDYVSWRTSISRPLTAVDEWISANSNVYARVSISRRRWVHITPEAAIRSVISQIVFDDLGLLAPPATDGTDSDEVLDDDYLFAALMPMEKGRRIRELMLQSTRDPIFVAISMSTHGEPRFNTHERNQPSWCHGCS